MNSIISKLKHLFGGEKIKTSSPDQGQEEQGQEEKVDIRPPMAELIPTGSEAADSPNSDGSETAQSENFSEPPPQRIVIQPKVIASAETLSDRGEILVKAQPSAMMDQCKFMVNRNLLKGNSWYFSSFESAAGSPLAESIFSVDGVETVLIHESTATLTRKDKSTADWRPLAKEVGAAIRSILLSGESLISAEVLDSIPTQEEVQAKIQEVIDIEVNPGVAGHGGHITLTQVMGNTVTIQMGGGCQGCSAADLTLKQGIHNSFRKALPTVGAIYDETDHKAGLNPYYS